MHIPSFVQGMIVAAVLGGAAALSASQLAPERRPPQQGTQPTYFVEHPDHVQPGLPLQGRFASLTNPYEGNAQRADEGSKLFVAYNCLDCHGADGSGAMGPSFQDGRWHFGGSPAEVFESIYQGRPDGMPAWGGRISNDQIWMLTAYVRSLASKDLSTENFTGKTVERTGH